MITDIDTVPWMKGIAIRAAERGIAILGFQRYRSYWYVMVYGQTDDNGCPLWAGVRVQEFIDREVWENQVQAHYSPNLNNIKKEYLPTINGMRSVLFNTEGICKISVDQPDDKNRHKWE